MWSVPDGRGVDGPRVDGARVDAPHVVDVSVWGKVRSQPPDDPAGLAAWFDRMILRGFVVLTPTIRHEVLSSARSGDAYLAQAMALADMRMLRLDTATVLRADELQRSLAARSHHRGVEPADLLAAAAAIEAGVPLLHYDHDFELIAEVSDLDARWFVPRGSLP